LEVFRLGLRLLTMRVFNLAESSKLKVKIWNDSFFLPGFELPPACSRYQVIQISMIG
jgi:hypothetical protein